MKRLLHSRLRRGAALLVADGLFFGTTNPAHVSPFLLIIALLLLTATLYWAIGSTLRFVRRYGGFTLENHRRLAMVLTAAIAGLLALQSISELSGRDVLVLVPLAMIVYLYVSYGRNQTPT